MTTDSNKPGMAFWIIGILALAWNAMGVNAYIQQAYKTDGFKEMFADSPELLKLALEAPTWYTAVFAIAVFGSTLACILLLLRKKLAVTLFFLGLVAVLIQTANALFVTGELQYYKAFNYSMFIAIPIVSLFLFWYSKKAKTNGWLS
jgi:hypothetical protein